MKLKFCGRFKFRGLAQAVRLGDRDSDGDTQQQREQLGHGIPDHRPRSPRHETVAWIGLDKSHDLTTESCHGCPARLTHQEICYTSCTIFGQSVLVV